MTLVTVGSPLPWPGFVGGMSAGPNMNNLATLTSAGHYVAYVFVARENMVVSHLCIKIAAANGSPTADYRIETVDASGLPSGTLWATNTNATSATLVTDTSPVVALTASATINRGQVFCVKIAYVSGTNFTIGNIGSQTIYGPMSQPYQVINTGSATKGQITGSATLALGSSSTTWYQLPGSFPIAFVNGAGFNNTNSQKRGMFFTIPFNCRAVGMRWFNAGTGTGDFNIILMNAAGTELSSSSTAFDGDHGSGIQVPLNLYFDNTVLLTAGTQYRLVVEPSTTTNVYVGNYQLHSSSFFGASPGGSNAVYTSFATATWTDATNQVPVMDLLIDQVDDGTGTGGVVGVVGG